MPTDKQIIAGQDAWESESAKWRLIEAPPFWLVQPNVASYVASASVADEPAYHKWSSKVAAQLFIREKIITAILTAAENA